MTTLIVSHDAGGAEILSSYVRRRRRSDYLFSLAGPAVKIFAGKLGSFENLELETAVQASDDVLCGSSWDSDLEWRALQLARREGRPSAVFLDHWINYRERFIKQGQEVLADRLWVGDPHAEALARRAFPGMSVELVENPYFIDQREQMALLRAAVSAADIEGLVLFIDEPIEEYNLRKGGDGRRWGYTEIDALRYLVSNLRMLLPPAKAQIVIRPHPAEKHPEEKYRAALHDVAVPVRISRHSTLLEDIAGCELVAGCESTALAVALLATKRVVSCVPPGGKPCSLPHPQIEHLQAIVAGFPS